MHKSATKCNETQGKWCKNKHGASKIIDTFETYHALGNRGSRRCGHLSEAGAQSPKGEQEEICPRGSRCSFIISPSWAAAGQQKQEGPCYLQSRCHSHEALRDNLSSAGPIMALARETGAPAAGLYLGRGVVHLHHPYACRVSGPAPPSVPIHGLDGRPGDGLCQAMGMQRRLALVSR
jgi:hypothetical protein